MSRPGTALKNFTDREDQQKRLIEIVSLPSTDHKTEKLPILSYYGISGVGQTTCKLAHDLHTFNLYSIYSGNP
jgi:hypothetical protein